MVFLKIEEIEKLTRYAEIKTQVSVPQIQKDFGWTYSKARAGVERLVNENQLEYKGGISYEFCGVETRGKQAKASFDFDIGDDIDDEDLDEYDFDEEDIDEELVNSVLKDAFGNDTDEQKNKLPDFEEFNRLNAATRVLLLDAIRSQPRISKHDLYLKLRKDGENLPKLSQEYSSYEFAMIFLLKISDEEFERLKTQI